MRQLPHGISVMPVLLALVLLLALSRPVPAQWERVTPGSGALELSLPPCGRRAELLGADRCREVAADLDFFAWRNTRLAPESGEDRRRAAEAAALQAAGVAAFVEFCIRPRPCLSAQWALGDGVAAAGSFRRAWEQANAGCRE